MLLNKTHNGCVGWAWLAGGRGLNATAISPIKITRLVFIQEAHKANSLQERTENAVPRRELSTAILPAKRTPRRPVSRPRFWPLLKGTHLTASPLHTSKPRQSQELGTESPRCRRLLELGQLLLSPQRCTHLPSTPVCSCAHQQQDDRGPCLK